jgi:hypothetical protein
MRPLVRQLRRLVGDDGPENERLFSDDELEQFLDTCRVFVVHAPLVPAEAPPTKLWRARQQFWEEGARVTGGEVAAEDALVGVWELVAETAGPLFVTGYTYDLYAAAADVLEVWAAREKWAYDVTVDGQTLRRSQVGDRLMALAQSYRRLARPVSAVTYRSDIEMEA